MWKYEVGLPTRVDSKRISEVDPDLADALGRPIYDHLLHSVQQYRAVERNGWVRSEWVTVDQFRTTLRGKILNQVRGRWVATPHRYPIPKESA